jgi:hypothetical protein
MALWAKSKLNELITPVIMFTSTVQKHAKYFMIWGHLESKCRHLISQANGIYEPDVADPSPDTLFNRYSAIHIFNAYMFLYIFHGYLGFKQLHAQIVAVAIAIAFEIFEASTVYSETYSMPGVICGVETYWQIFGDILCVGISSMTMSMASRFRGGIGACAALLFALLILSEAPAFFLFPGLGYTIGRPIDLAMCRIASHLPNSQLYPFGT